MGRQQGGRNTDPGHVHSALATLAIRSLPWPLSSPSPLLTRLQAGYFSPATSINVSYTDAKHVTELNWFLPRFFQVSSALESELFSLSFHSFYLSGLRSPRQRGLRCIQVRQGPNLKALTSVFTAKRRALLRLRPTSWWPQSLAKTKSFFKILFKASYFIQFALRRAHESKPFPVDEPRGAKMKDFLFAFNFI